MSGTRSSSHMPIEALQTSAEDATKVMPPKSCLPRIVRFRPRGSAKFKLDYSRNYLEKLIQIP